MTQHYFMKHTLFFSFLFSMFVNFYLHSEDEKPKSSQNPLDCPYIYASVNVISGEYCEAQTDLTLEGPHPLTLKRFYNSLGDTSVPNGLGWHFSHPNLPIPLNEEEYQPQFPNKKIVYDYDDDLRLKQIKTTDLKGKVVYNSLCITYEDEPALTCQVEASDGRRVIYKYTETDPSRTESEYLLEEVVLPDGVFCSYQYDGHPTENKHLVVRREEPEGRYLINEYYLPDNNSPDVVKDEDPMRSFHIGKVKAQMAPVGCDNAPIVTHRFHYQPGCTEVRDALDNKIVYRYEGKLLTAVESYLKNESGEDCLYRTERFFWKNGLMVSRTLEDSQGIVWLCRSYAYDDQGALIRETIWGNLTGKTEVPIVLDEEGLPSNKGVESYSIRYQYTQDDSHRLISQIEDNGISTYYRYDPDTHLLIGKHTIAENSIRLRRFYFYDEDGVLTKTLQDDGTTEDPDNFTGVTERHITCLHSTKNPALYGVPEIIEEKYFDFLSKQEKVLKQSVHHYSPYGKLLQKDIYDSSGKLSQSLSYHYDRQGRLISTQDENGVSSSWEYDVNGNKVSLTTGNAIGECQQSRQDFDFANRQIRAEHCNEKGKVDVQTFRYDFNGNKIASTDSYGNETEYAYDSLGRLIEMVYPIVVDAHNCVIRPTKKFSYNIFDHLIAHVDLNNYETHTRYNVRGKPIEIQYPDGTKECFEYDLSGALRESKAKNGTRVLYHRDCLGHVVKTEMFGPDGHLLSSTSSVYNAFHLLSATDARGTTVHYAYDGAGRQISQKSEREEGFAFIEWDYDSLGQIKSKKEWFGDGPVDYVETRHQRDDVNQLKSVSIFNAQGELLKQSSLDLSEKASAYKTTCNEKYYNDLGQNVPQVIETLANGINVISSYDALGRIESIVRKNSLGQVLSQQEMRYDAAGNKVRETHKCISSDGVLGSFTIAWWYGPGNRLEAVSEGIGTSAPRHSVYLYNDFGQLENIVKPDGTMLVHRYNPAGYLAELFSTDHTIHYEYLYDANCNITTVKNLVDGTSTERAYNEANLLAYEKIGNGLQLVNQYDRMGRRTQMTLPDLSSIQYSYDGANLTDVHRLGASGENLYTHSYTKFDREGTLMTSKIICELGEIHYIRDEKSRVRSIVSPYWSEEIPEDGYDAQGNLLKASFEDSHGKYDLCFAYNERAQLANESSIFKRSYIFDSLENLIEQDQAPVKCDFLNQMTATKSHQYRYDPNGNVIEKCSGSSTTLYEYDALNRLISVTDPGRNSTRYTYDSFHRRLAKSDFRWDKEIASWKPIGQTRYLYDGQNEIGSADSKGRINELRVLGMGIGAEIGAAVAIELDGSIYAPVHDHRGSICSLVDVDTRQSIECYRYSAFGETQILDNNGSVRSESKVSNPWRFSGKRYDDESGLVYFGKRYYAPEIGRWTTLDPLGFADGPNRYAYAQNNPMMRVDLYGLWSFNTIWKQFLSTCSSAIEAASNLMNTMQQHLSYQEYIRDDIEDMGHKLVGAAFLRMVGYYSQPPETGVYGSGEINDKIRVTLVNGILNIRHDFMESVKMVSETHGGVNVHYIFRPTEGWAWDVIKCTLVKCGLVSIQARQLADTWKKLIQEMGGTQGGGIIIHYAHSIGGTDTYIAKHLLTPEEQKMIRVVTFGSATMIPNTGFQSVINYVSRRDGVTLFDPLTRLMGLFEDNSNIIYVGTHLGIPLVDHLFDAHTYRSIMEALGQEFTRLYTQAA